VRSQVPVAGPSCQLGFGKGAAGTLQVIVAGHRSKVLWSICQGRLHEPRSVLDADRVELYLHRDVRIETSASKLSERVGEN
jgi:hypothetical protein